MVKLAPSILSADFYRLGEQIEEMKDEIEILHIDVMDGCFVPSITFGMPVVETLRPHTDLFFDLHLMIQDPDLYISEFKRAGADSITIHAEASRDLEQSIRMIHDVGCKAGVAINPETPLSKIEPVLGQIDMVLIMLVHPGKGGQQLIPETVAKLGECYRIRKEKNLSFLIEVDGGIHKENIGNIAKQGADYIVAGTAVFRGNIADNIQQLKEKIANAS